MSCEKGFTSGKGKKEWVKRTVNKGRSKERGERITILENQKEQRDQDRGVSR